MRTRQMHSSGAVHDLLGTVAVSNNMAEKGTGSCPTEKPAAGSPSKFVRLSNKGAHVVHHNKKDGWWNGDKSYYRHQVERLGFRFHQPGESVPRRAPGTFRAAEGHNDLRNLLAAQPVLHMGPTSGGTGVHQRSRRSKRIDVSRVNQTTWNLCMQNSGTGAADSRAAETGPSSMVGIEPAILNSDQVRAALVPNPDGSINVQSNVVGNRKLLGGMTSRQFDAKIIERENVSMCREKKCSQSRSQPAMKSTLPIAWEQGSSWNPEGNGSNMRTSSQVMNSGERIGHRNPFENARRLGRNRSVLQSQIVLG